ncbi:hypothetical protein OG562_16925 [Streptomyces sp. NBC_01275]|uniref:hypothetical protein n=1 Tax=Streptomyces sp. NBC_01275 TaxID=2903807 RepID=UPI00224EFAE5|nr:hypothetical protein [Streptomyces sp. NBC_01275]MCX4762630.1 hypothetical protein [Streptomyces sp. NBC_01275]
MPFAAARVPLLPLPLPPAAAPEASGGWSAAPSGGGRPSFPDRAPRTLPVSEHPCPEVQSTGAAK